MTCTFICNGSQRKPLRGVTKRYMQVRRPFCRFFRVFWQLRSVTFRNLRASARLSPALPVHRRVGRCPPFLCVQCRRNAQSLLLLLAIVVIIDLAAPGMAEPQPSRRSMWQRASSPVETFRDSQSRHRRQPCNLPRRYPLRRRRRTDHHLSCGKAGSEMGCGHVLAAVDRRGRTDAATCGASGPELAARAADFWSQTCLTMGFPPTLY